MQIALNTLTVENYIGFSVYQLLCCTSDIPYYLLTAWRKVYEQYTEVLMIRQYSRLRRREMARDQCPTSGVHLQVRMCSPTFHNFGTTGFIVLKCGVFLDPLTVHFTNAMVEDIHTFAHAAHIPFNHIVPTFSSPKRRLIRYLKILA